MHKALAGHVDVCVVARDTHVLSVNVPRSLNNWPCQKMDKQVHMSHVSSWKMFILILHRIYCMIKFGNPGLKDNFSYLHTVTQSMICIQRQKNDDNETIKDHQITYPLHILSCQTVKQNTCVTWPVEVSRNNENWNDNNNIKKSKQ